MSHDRYGNRFDDVIGITNVHSVGANASSYSQVVGNLYGWEFAGNATKELYFNIQLPHTYREGSAIYPHVHWTHATAGGGGGDIAVTGSSGGVADGTYVSQGLDPYGLEYFKRTSPSVLYLSKSSDPTHGYWCIATTQNPVYFNSYYISSTSLAATYSGIGAYAGTTAVVASSGGASGNVKMQMTYTWSNNNAGHSAEATSSFTDAVEGAEQYFNLPGSFPSIDGAGRRVSSIFSGKLFRDPSDAADTYTGSIWLLGFDLHITKDKPGTINEFSVP